MTVSDLLTYCMDKPGAEQSVHSGWKATQIKLDDVLFALVHEVEGRPAVALKSTPRWLSCCGTHTVTYGPVNI